jgi:hypothetical protein
LKVAPVELVEEKPPRFRAGCCDRKRRTPTRYRCHCEFSFSPSLRPPFIIMLGQSACPSWCSGLQLDPSLPRVASQPARPGAAARRFPLSIAAVHGQSACPSWCSGLQLDSSSQRVASQPARLGAAARRFLSCMYRSRGYQPTACTTAESSFNPPSSLCFFPSHCGRA